MRGSSVPKQLRSTSFPLAQHSHGKTKVRVLKVNKIGSVHHVYEYSVTTILHTQLERVFTSGDNTGLIATDTQKNIIYVIAKRTSADSPERFGIDLCRHFMTTYSQLTAVEVELIMTKWKRVTTVDSNRPHPHGFEKSSPEVYQAHVRIDRDNDGKKMIPPVVTSSIKNLTVLKTAQSGFENYHFDKYTLLKPTSQRCMATEMECTWKYVEGVHGTAIDYNAIREHLREQIIKGYYGSHETGVYSVSLQATIYDIACLILQDLPMIASVKIFTPNLHYLPMLALEKLGEKFGDDVLIPTDEPSGIISCTVNQNEAKRMTSRL